uniref:Uncharacterized protein n=1 Tax=Aegilops tauschii subsp. strangulata TaxID=200361 RepID=A0A453SLX2_AEGTS
GGLLRERVRLLRGGDHGRGAVRTRAGLRAGAGEEGQVGSDVRLPVVDGGPDGARGRPLFTLSQTYIVSDVSHAGFKSVDFGWGEAVYGGPAKDGEGPIPGVTNYFSRSKNGKGEEGTVVPISLPK